MGVHTPEQTAMLAGEYELHGVTFKRKGELSYSPITGAGANLQDWHLVVLKEWIAKAEKRDLPAFAVQEIDMDDLIGEPTKKKTREIDLDDLI